MFGDLLAIAHLIDQEEDGSFCLACAEWSGKSLVLSLDISMNQYPDVQKHWQVTCLGVREHSLSLGSANQLQWRDDHVLLWGHTKRRLSVYFSGKGKTPNVIIGALYQRHSELTKDWLPFQRFLNPNMDLMRLITGSSGMLAEGPEPLMLAYEEVLQRFGFSVSHVDAGEPAYWNGETWLEEREKLSVLIMDKSYIIAEEFTARTV